MTSLIGLRWKRGWQSKNLPNGNREPHNCCNGDKEESATCFTSSALLLSQLSRRFITSGLSLPVHRWAELRNAIGVIILEPDRRIRLGFLFYTRGFRAIFWPRFPIQMSSR